MLSNFFITKPPTNIFGNGASKVPKKICQIIESKGRYKFVFLFLDRKTYQNHAIK